MTDVDHTYIINRSWKQLKENLYVLLIPTIVGIGLLFLMLLILAVEFFIVASATGPFPTVANPEAVMLYLSSAPMALLVLFSVIDLFLVLYFVSYLTAMSIGAFKEVTSGNMPTRHDLFDHARNMWQKVLKIIIFILIVLSILIYSLISLFILVSAASLPIITAIAIMVALLILLFIAFAALALTFIMPAMAEPDKGALGSLKHCLRFARKNKLDTIITWAITLAISIMASILSSLIEFIPVLGPLIAFSISVFAGIYTGLILFNAYHDIASKDKLRNKKKIKTR